MTIRDVDERGDEEFLQYKKLFLSELSRLNKSVERLETRMEDLHTEIVMLKIKSGIWGGLAGLIPVLLAILLQLFSATHAITIDPTHPTTIERGAK
jgi:hypothetical protein